MDPSSPPTNSAPTVGSPLFGLSDSRMKTSFHAADKLKIVSTAESEPAIAKPRWKESSDALSLPSPQRAPIDQSGVFSHAVSSISCHVDPKEQCSDGLVQTAHQLTATLDPPAPASSAPTPILSGVQTDTTSLDMDRWKRPLDESLAKQKGLSKEISDLKNREVDMVDEIEILDEEPGKVCKIIEEICAVGILIKKSRANLNDADTKIVDTDGKLRDQYAKMLDCELGTPGNDDLLASLDNMNSERVALIETRAVTEKKHQETIDRRVALIKEYSSEWKAHEAKRGVLDDKLKAVRVKIGELEKSMKEEKAKYKGFFHNQ